MKNWIFLFIAVVFGCSYHNPPVLKKSYVIPFERTESNLLIVSAIVSVNPDHPEVHPSPKRLAI
jgi:hypothetical protein